MFVVVTTFYTLDGMKSILLPEFVFFRFRLRLSLQNTNPLFYCFIFFYEGVALRIITYPAPFTQGSLGRRKHHCKKILPLRNLTGRILFCNRAYLQQLNKLEFGGQCPLTIRARCSAFRYCPDPLGIVTAEQFVKLEFI